MSPEQARGKEIDSRSDIWSLGVVIYEMLSRRTPFAEETTSDAIAAILTRERAPLDENIPAELQRIIRKSLQKKADERYQTIRDLQLDLKALKAGPPVFRGTGRSQIPPLDQIVERQNRSAERARHSDSAGGGFDSKVARRNQLRARNIWSAQTEITNGALPRWWRWCSWR